MSRHITYANVTATLALILAMSGVSYAAIAIPRNSVGTTHLKRNAVTGSKIRNGAVGEADLARTVRARLDAARRGATGPSGPAGPTGPTGPAGATGAKGDRGLSVAGSRQVPNAQDIACGTDVVVGTLPLTVPEPSRIWTHAHGVIQNENSGNDEAALWLRLRDAANTTTLAVSVASWDGRLPALSVSTLTTGGLLLAGEDPNGPADPYTAATGTYVLEFIARIQGSACAGPNKPDFGWNQGAAMGYLLVGPA